MANGLCLTRPQEAHEALAGKRRIRGQAAERSLKACFDAYLAAFACDME